MKHGILIFSALSILGLGAAGIGPVPAPDSEGQLTAAVLNSEYGLAKGPDFYFVLDLKGGRMELKVKGVVMKTWPLQGVRFWGRPDFPATIEISRKSALRAPRRFKIKPPQDNEERSDEVDPAGFELDALEISDMPRGFSLISKEGARLMVRARGGGPGSWLGSVVSFVAWRTLIPVQHLFRTMARKPRFAVEIWFKEKKDAQYVYWTFFEGIKGIVF